MSNASIYFGYLEAYVHFTLFSFVRCLRSLFKPVLTVITNFVLIKLREVVFLQALG